MNSDDDVSQKTTSTYGMSHKRMYRMEVDSRAQHPGDGDHYALAVHPPLNRDDVYCRIYCNGRTWGGSARPQESRDEAIDYIHSKLETLEEKATDDKSRGSLPRYPDLPKPANTRYIVHPDYEGEIGPREVWGDATLASFGAGTTSRFDDTPWYETRDAYQTHLAPLRNAGDSRVVRVFAQDITEMAYWWFTTDSDEQLLGVRYRPRSERHKTAEWTWTSATRRIGGIGITNAPPADLRTVAVDETPFADGFNEAAVEDWLEREQPPALEKAEANQVDGDEMPSRHSEASA